MPKPEMDPKTAMDLADDMDLPDGAYWAMLGDLMGLDYEDVMDMMAELDDYT